MSEVDPTIFQPSVVYVYPPTTISIPIDKRKDDVLKLFENIVQMSNQITGNIVNVANLLSIDLKIVSNDLNNVVLESDDESIEHVQEQENSDKPSRENISNNDVNLDAGLRFKNIKTLVDENFTNKEDLPTKTPKETYFSDEQNTIINSNLTYTIGQSASNMVNFIKKPESKSDIFEKVNSLNNDKLAIGDNNNKTLIDKTTKVLGSPRISEKEIDESENKNIESNLKMETPDQNCEYTENDSDTNIKPKILNDMTKHTVNQNDIKYSCHFSEKDFNSDIKPKYLNPDITKDLNTNIKPKDLNPDIRPKELNQDIRPKELNQDITPKYLIPDIRPKIIPRINEHKSSIFNPASIPIISPIKSKEKMKETENTYLNENKLSNLILNSKCSKTKEGWLGCQKRLKKYNNGACWECGKRECWKEKQIFNKTLDKENQTNLKYECKGRKIMSSFCDDNFDNPSRKNDKRNRKVKEKEKEHQNNSRRGTRVQLYNIPSFITDSDIIDCFSRFSRINKFDRNTRSNTQAFLCLEDFPYVAQKLIRHGKCKILGEEVRIKTLLQCKKC